MTFLNKPKTIVEFGILDGYSLDSFIENSDKECQIYACDIFEDFIGNGSEYNVIMGKYKNIDNVHIGKCDFYQEYKNIKDDSVDILHVDIANDGTTYDFCINNYYNKIRKNGFILLEGGSKDRDNVEWMLKYDKKPIAEYLEKIKDKYEIMTIDTYPSMTIVKK